MLQSRGFDNVGYWSRGVAHEVFYPRVQHVPAHQREPVFLYAGRLAVEKNIDAFLRLDLPGSKWVAGGGPLAESLRRRYHDVRFLGVLTADELAQVYSQADVFVFPSLTDTFGLVMVEAMACGLPVAAFPVAGPLDVVGDSGAGVLSDDLHQACIACLSIDRSQAVQRAAQFTWPEASAQFYRALTQIRDGQPERLAMAI
jgi:glycosyltransferase involved in cell wall biosynthesis